MKQWKIGFNPHLSERQLIFQSMVDQMCDIPDTTFSLLTRGRRWLEH